MNGRPGPGAPRPPADRTASVAALLRDHWRRTGADLPGGDPLLSHQAPMEGYLWRFTDPARGRVLLVACGVNHHRRHPWGTVVVAAHPSGLVRSASVDGARASTTAYEVSAPPIFRLGANRLRVRIGEDVDINCALDPVRTWPPRRLLHGSGVFSLVPGLNHYWHPHLFDAKAEGTARLAGDTWDLSTCRVYAEKSWGRGFPRSWWWGQAHGFDRPDVCVAFAGGLLGRGPATVKVSGLVLTVDDHVLSLVPPVALVRGSARDGVWRLSGRSARHQVDLTGETDGSPALPLPIPLLQPHRFGHSLQHMAGNLRVRVRRDGREVYAGSSVLAGLETGEL
ncbi:tocopherol cyclase family protein [Streptomyces sp. DH12]|uniref:tocopherol cyclase family protein n=1 Tax=Streptomyces sp. DH12 TaxID=2857010 RepID=UPI001E41C9C8|nr:tocopherol cyclase family protein [Streptomyces sp. DH12]